MNKILFFLISIFLTFSTYLFSDNVKKVGAIIYAKPFLASLEGFKTGLKKIGYIENKNIIFYVKNINGDLKKVSNILKSFSKNNIDLIFTTTTFVALAVKKEINKYKIPVIFNEVGAPVVSNVVKSLAKPDGYLTGVNHAAYSFVPKRVEIFKDVFPMIKRIIFFYNPDKGYFKDQEKLIKEVTKELGLAYKGFFIRNRNDLESYLDKLQLSKNDGILMYPDAIGMANADLQIKISHKFKIPLMVLDNILISKGGCIGYSPSFFDIGVQSAYIAKLIFSGVYPGNIPVLFPEKIELAINLKEIKKLGLEEVFNKEYLKFADKIIE